jgi:hypothetical protein
MISGLKSIRRERAKLERDRVVLGSMMEDAKIADALDALTDTILEGVSDDQMEDLIDRIPESDEEDEQVEKILASDNDEGLDVDEILDVDETSELA